MRKILFLLALALMPLSAQAVVVSVGQVVYPTATIAAGQSTSAAISNNAMSLVGCHIPTGFTGTSISFTVASTLTGSYQELDNTSGKLSYTVAGNKYISINPVDFYGVQFFKIVSNATEGSARSLACSLKGI